LKQPRAALLLMLAATAAGCAGRSTQSVPASPPTHQAGPLTILGGGLELRLSGRKREALAHGDDASARRRARRYLNHHTASRGARWTVRVAWSQSAASLVAAAARRGASSVSPPAAVAEVQLKLPAIRQASRDGCESAALAMLLGGRVGQDRLQHLLPVARPYLPQAGPTGTVWGDPEQGFVGNVHGGGYGVYDRPLLALARRYDPGATNLTGTSVARIAAALRSGRPVVAWIQFGPSIPRRWTTPAGRVVNANFAEHAVTLTGWKPGEIAYNNPWTGTRATFTIAGFTRLWHALGDRAIAGSSLFDRAGG
jgi:uncharacterized protein YvpB